MDALAEYDFCSGGDLPEPQLDAIPLENIFSVLQTREFLEHKYYLSQSHGYDVGSNFTWEHWIGSGHADRFRRAFDRNVSNIQRACEQYCNQACNVYAQHAALGRKNGISDEEIAACPLPSDLLHLLLENRPV